MSEMRVLDDPGRLVDALIAAGWRVVGPRVRDGTLAYAPLEAGADLARGWTDAQSPGSYRLTEGDPERWFDTVVAPASWKPWLYPARRKLWSAERTADGFDLTPAADDWPATALFGVRPCDLAAIERQDAIFGGADFADPTYTGRRARSLIVAVQCARAAETCFCAAMDTGPRARAGFDLALTELPADAPHRFLLETGSAAGDEIAAALDLSEADAATRDAAEEVSRATAAMQTRTMPAGIAKALRDRPEHPGWDDVAGRCLNCANCTLACPTCFCSDVEDTTDLSGDHAERWQVWDSCFNPEFSYIHGGAIRRSSKSRYRQWMTHKLAHWHDQFGASGCVGCGRCITWCPVGIDITAEAHRLADMGDRP